MNDDFPLTTLLQPLVCPFLHALSLVIYHSIRALSLEHLVARVVPYTGKVEHLYFASAFCLALEELVDDAQRAGVHDGDLLHKKMASALVVPV